MKVRVDSVALLLALASCHSFELPEGSGDGLVSFDREPPAGAELFERPEWKVGDRFVFRRGSALTLASTVTAAGEDGYTLVNDKSGRRTFYTADFGALGEEHPDDPRLRTALAPADHLLHWPLWVGKQWSCHFLRKTPGQPPLPLTVLYRVEDIDTITVPAGELRCPRILRRVRVAAEGNYLEQTALLWYSPEIGVLARQLENGTLLELEEFQRQ